MTSGAALTEITAKPLTQEEAPLPGDLHFAVGFSPGSALVSRIIAVGTTSRTNHVGIIVEATNEKWEVIEALGAGVRRNAHEPPPWSTVMRVSDDPSVRDQVVQHAVTMSANNIKYDWWTIGRIVFVGFFGRVPFLTLPLLAWPWLARALDPVWAAPLIVAFAVVALYTARPWLFAASMAVPWPDPPDRMICSEFTRRVLEATFGDGALDGLAAVKPSMTAPGDLLQALLGRSDYSTARTGIPRAVADYTRRLPRRPR
jgi:hypothetical protein